MSGLLLAAPGLDTDLVASKSAFELSPTPRGPNVEYIPSTEALKRRTFSSKSQPGDIHEFALESLRVQEESTRMHAQHETFCNWFNDRLGGRSDQTVSNLSLDLRDGLLLLKLLENLTQKEIKGYEKAPKVTAHKMVNLDLAFQFLRNQGVKLVGISSHNIYNGDTKLILGLVWTLIQKYQIRIRGAHVSTKAIVVEWLKALLPSWNIHNLSTDWNDGRALVALINEVKPGVAPDVATLNPTKHTSNCTLGINIAHDRLKIPKIVSPYDLSSSKLDEKSVMTYLSYFVDPARTKLLKWVRKQLPQFSITNFTTNWADGKAFAALVNTCFPGMFKDWEKLESQRGMENAQQVFEITRKNLGVEPSFTPRQLILTEIEELQVMTYIMRVRDGSMKSLPDVIVPSGPGIKNAKVGKQTSFQIDTTQAGPGKLFIDAYYDNKRKVKFHLKEKQSGVVTLTYTPDQCGTIHFDVLWSDTPIPNSPFDVVVTDSSLVRILDFENHKTAVLANEPVELCLSTEQAGEGVLTAHLKYSKEAPIDAVVSNLPDSVVKLQYSPPKAGRPSLRVFWNGQELSHLTITYSVIDKDNYRVAKAPEERIYHVYEHVNFSVQSKGLPLESLQMMAIMGDDIQIPASFMNMDGNLGHAYFRPTLPGLYRVEVACIDSLVQGSPFHVEVTDTSRCKLLGEIPESILLGEPFSLSVNTRDAGDGPLTFECMESETSPIFNTTVSEPDNHGNRQIEVTPLQVGEYLVGVKFHGREIPRSPFRVKVCDPAKCKVSRDLLDLKSGTVDKPIRFHITMAEPDDPIKPTVKASGPSAKYTPDIRKTDDNTYAVQFTPWEIGTHEISVMYGGFHVQKSPFLISVSGIDSDFVSATGKGLQEAFTGVPAQFVVLAKQEGLLKDSSLQITVSGVVNNVNCRVRARDNENGSYNVAYLVEMPGAYLIKVKVRDQDIPGSPFKLNVQPGPKAGKCRMYGPALEPEAILTIGKPIDFSVDASKAGVGHLLVRAVGPGGIQARVYLAKTEKRGVYDIRLDPIKAGKYRVSVKWSGTHIPGSPFIMKVFPGADASKCKAYGPGLMDGLVGEMSSFIIETRNAGAGTLKVRLHGIRNAFKVEIKPKDQRDVRTLEAKYDPQKPGEYLITIKWSEQHIPGSPFRVKIQGEGIIALPSSMEENNNTPLKATPINEDLMPIMEEDENELLTAQSAPAVANPSRARKKRKKSKQEQEAATADPIPIPNFTTHRTQRPFHNTFVHGHQPNRHSKSYDSLHIHTSSLPPRKMMTFSNLQQVRKHAKAATAPSKPIKGKYYGQATMHVNSMNARKIHKSSK